MDFRRELGAMNALLVQIRLIDSYRIWLGEPLTAMHLVIVANIWKETPVAVILFLAALQSIPKALYEAARVDGANSRQSFLNITLPC
jgi:ABC-type sugar transport system permease subunit